MRVEFLLFIMLMAGCVPVPFATPPATVAVHGGGASGASNGGATLAVRAGLSPLGAVEVLEDRAFDLSLGYLWEDAASRPGGAHGGFLEVAGWPVHVGDSGRFRFGPVARGVVHTDGWGADVGVTLEYSKHVVDVFSSVDDTDDDTYDGSDSDDGEIVGLAFGELGIGLGLTGGWRALHDGGRSWLVLAGVHIRLPPSLGLLLIPIPLD
jgi:hypothetical protein